MKKYIISALVLFGCSPVFALTMEDLKTQLIDNTKLTITKEGGPAAFYDASIGNDPSLKEGVIDHILTNRFVTLDMGWFSADGKEAVVVGGVGLVLDKLVQTLSPDMAARITGFVPQLLTPLNVGVTAGWGSDRGTFHYGASLSYNFGK